MGVFWEPISQDEANKIISLYNDGFGGDKIIIENDKRLVLAVLKRTFLG